MEYSLYADEVVFLNTLINYFLLLSSLVLGRCPIRRLWVLLGAFLSAIYALFALFPSLSFLYFLPCKLLAALLAGMIACRFQVQYLRVGFFFVLTSLLFGGLITALVYLTHSASPLFISSGLYVPASLRWAAVLSSLLYYLILRLFTFALPKRQEVILCVFSPDGRVVKFRLFPDSGSGLMDPFRNRPCPVLSLEKLRFFFTDTEYSVLSSLPPEEALPVLKGSPRRFGLLPIQTAGGQALLLTFHMEKVILDKEPISDYLLALSVKGFSPQSGYDGIIGI